MAPKDDVDRIMAVMEAAFDPEYGEAWTRAQIESALVLGGCDYWLIGADGVIGTAPGDGETAGFALVRRTLDEAELLLFAVARDWRRRGLGASLLHAVQQDLLQRGVREMLLEMRRGNSAERLYSLHGFSPIGVRPKYYLSRSGERIDAITFNCNLISTFG